MPIKIASMEESYLMLYRRLSKDWIVIEGDPDAITSLEYELYTPGTARSADLELAILPGLPPRPIMIGRKLPELRTKLKLDDDPDLWDSLFLMYLEPHGELMSIATEHLTPGVSREEYMQEFVKELLDMPPEGGEGP